MVPSTPDESKGSSVMFYILFQLSKRLTSDSIFVSMIEFKGCAKGGFTWANVWCSIFSISTKVRSSILSMFHPWCDKFLELILCCSSLVTFDWVYK